MDALAAREAYLYGYYGVPDKLLSSHPLFYTALPDSRQQEIYDIGKNARDRQIETKWQKIQEKKNAAALPKMPELADIERGVSWAEEDATAKHGEENLATAADTTAPEAEIIQPEDELPVEESAERGIISREELYRKAPDSRKGFKFISQERFDSLTVEARKNGATIVRGTPEVERHLTKMDASASHLGGTLLFMKDVCVSDVLEETYHHMQNLRGLNDDKESTLRTILNEIDAKQYLLDNAQKYKIPRNEIELTRKQLEGYKKQLEEYGRK